LPHAEARFIPYSEWTEAIELPKSRQMKHKPAYLKRFTYDTISHDPGTPSSHSLGRRAAGHDRQ
jgi:hypothetical protein